MKDPRPQIRPQLVYSTSYDIRFLGLEKLHPFDSCKYGRVWRALQQGLGPAVASITLTPPAPAEDETLLLVHEPDYLRRLKKSRYIAKVLELSSLSCLPRGMLHRCILTPMRLATTGTIFAATAALQGGIGINLSGGYHHAQSAHGEGFCAFADVAIAIAHLRRSQLLSPEDHVLIVDLDAHQGNGVARIFQHDPRVHILDMYNRDIYPRDPLAISRVDCDIPLSSGTRDQDYLGQLQEHLLAFLETIPPPKIAFYNAGTDVYAGDPLGRLRVSDQGVLDRDCFVFHTLTERGIPWAMVLSGGYTYQSYQLVANSVAYVLHTWGGPPFTS